MKYLIRCNECLSTAWVRGTVEEGGAFFVNDDQEPEWNEGDHAEDCSCDFCRNGCDHEDFQVIDEESDEPE